MSKIEKKSVIIFRMCQVNIVVRNKNEECLGRIINYLTKYGLSILMCWIMFYILINYLTKYGLSILMCWIMFYILINYLTKYGLSILMCWIMFYILINYLTKYGLSILMCGIMFYIFCSVPYNHMHVNHNNQYDGNHTVVSVAIANCFSEFNTD